MYRDVHVMEFRLNMTEKLFTGTLNHNKKKRNGTFQCGTPFQVISVAYQWYHFQFRLYAIHVPIDNHNPHKPGVLLMGQRQPV